MVQILGDELQLADNLKLFTQHVVDGLRLGSHKGPLFGASVEFSEHKEYNFGDDPKHIDWKLFGKSNKYYVKKFEEETNLSTYILLDASASMSYGSHYVKNKNKITKNYSYRVVDKVLRVIDKIFNKNNPKKTVNHINANETTSPRLKKIEYSALLASIFSYILLNQRDSVGLYINKETPIDIKASSKPSQMSHIVNSLINIEAIGSASLLNAIQLIASRLKKHSVIIVISDFLDFAKEPYTIINELLPQKNDVIFLHIVDPDEESFPFSETYTFVDPELKIEDIVVNANDLRTSYQKEFSVFLDSFYEYCLKNDISYHKVVTNISLIDQVRNILYNRISFKKIK